MILKHLFILFCEKDTIQIGPCVFKKLSPFFKRYNLYNMKDTIIKKFTVN